MRDERKAGNRQRINPQRALAVATRLRDHTPGRLRAIGLEQLAFDFADAGSFHARQSPEVDPFNLLEQVLELVRQKLCVVGARRKMHLGANLSAAPLHDGERAAAGQGSSMSIRTVIRRLSASAIRSHCARKVGDRS